MSQIIIFVTGNRNKFSETHTILGKEIKLIQSDTDLPELQGEPQDIVSEKCKLAFKKFGCPVIVEDTSLSFNALNGLPGPYIKWFFKKIGNDGLYKMVEPYEDKSGYAICIFGYLDKSLKEPILLEGRVDGLIVPPKGKTNFGWDPIFLPLDFKKELPAKTLCIGLISE